MKHSRSKSHQSSFSIPSDVTKYLRLNPKSINVKQLLDHEIEESFLKDHANSIHHYDLQYKLSKPVSKNPNPYEIPFFSLHRLPDGRAKNTLIELLERPIKNPLEPEVLKEIDRKHGKQLSELNIEFNNEITREGSFFNTTQVKLPPISTKNSLLKGREQKIKHDGENAEKQVESLDQWLQHHVKREPKNSQKAEKILQKAKINSPDTPLLKLKTQADEPTKEQPVTEGPSKGTKKSRFSNGTREHVEENQQNQAPVPQMQQDNTSSTGTSERRNSETRANAEKGIRKKPSRLLSLNLSHEIQRIFHAGILKNIEDNLHERFDFQGIQIDEKTLMTRVDFYEKKNKQIMDKILGMMKDIETDIKDRQNKIDALRAEEDKIYKANQLRKQLRAIKLQKASGSLLLNRSDTGMTQNTPSALNDRQKITGSLEIQLEKPISPAEEIEKLEKEILQKKQELKVILTSKKKFLFQILEKGLDVRDKGLSWILKSLWADGATAGFDNLPAFLDNRSKSYLLKVSKLEVELEDCLKEKQTIVEIYKAAKDQETPEDSQCLFSSILRAEETPEQSFLQVSQPKISTRNSSQQSSIEILPSQDEPNQTAANSTQKVNNHSMVARSSFSTGSGVLESYEIKLPSRLRRNFSPKTPIKSPEISIIESTVAIPERLDEPSSPTKKPSKNSLSALRLQKIVSVNKESSERTKPETLLMLHKAEVDESMQNSSMNEKKRHTENERVYGTTRQSLLKLIGNLEKRTQMKSETSQDGLDNGLKLFEGNNLLNDYETKAQFLKKIENFQDKAAKIQAMIREENRKEIDRVLTEFQDIEYQKKWNTDIITVLSALFGGKRSLKILKHPPYKSRITPSASTTVI